MVMMKAMRMPVVMMIVMVTVMVFYDDGGDDDADKPAAVSRQLSVLQIYFVSDRFFSPSITKQTKC